MSQGKPGYCKICSHAGAQFLNARYEREGKDFNAARAAEFAKTLDPKFTFTRTTWYSHLDHITHPLVTAADAARQNPIVPKSSTGGLEMIRDIALKRAAEHPEEVSIDHGLKAMTELNRKQTGQDAALVLIAKILSGEQPAEVIVGEWRELPASEEDSPVGS